MYIPGEKSRKKAEKLIKVIWPNARMSRPFTKKKEIQAEESSNKGPENGNRIQDHAHEDDESYDYKSTHAGYQAVHYVIKNDLKAVKKTSDDKMKYGYEAGDQLEIQVVSALLHGWAEAQHDVLYKTLAYGEPSIAEQRILDAINGILLSGDLLLEQFHELFYAHVFRRFNEVDELTRFVRNLGVSHHRDLFPEQCLTNLIGLLRKHGKDFPMAARECFKQLEAPDDQRLDDLTANLVRKPWIGCVRLAHRLEAICSVGLDFDSYITPKKKAIAVMTTLNLLEDLTDGKIFDVLFADMTSLYEKLDVMKSLRHIFDPPDEFWKYDVHGSAAELEVSPAWNWLKSTARNYLPGLIF